MKIIKLLYTKYTLSFSICLISSFVVFFIFSLISNLNEDYIFSIILNTSILNSIQILTYVPAFIFLISLIFPHENAVKMRLANHCKNAVKVVLQAQSAVKMRSKSLCGFTL